MIATYGERTLEVFDKHFLEHVADSNLIEFSYSHSPDKMAVNCLALKQNYQKVPMQNIAAFKLLSKFQIKLKNIAI